MQRLSESIECGVWYCCSLSHAWLLVTPWTLVHQAPLSRGLSRQEYQSGLLFPSPGHLPDPGIKPSSLAGGSLTPEAPGEPMCKHEHNIVQSLIPELLRLTCRLTRGTSWSDTHVPLPLLLRLQSCFVSLCTLIDDRSGKEPVCQCKRYKRCRFDREHTPKKDTVTGSGARRELGEAR